jgi:hypothetical protein
MIITSPSLAVGGLQVDTLVGLPARIKAAAEEVGVVGAAGGIHGDPDVVVDDHRLNCTTTRNRPAVDQSSIKEVRAPCAQDAGVSLGAEVGGVQVTHGEPEEAGPNPRGERNATAKTIPT